jgi:hypothetical protein
MREPNAKHTQLTAHDRQNTFTVTTARTNKLRPKGDPKVNPQQKAA